MRWKLEGKEKEQEKKYRIVERLCDEWNKKVNRRRDIRLDRDGLREYE